MYTHRKRRIFPRSKKMKKNGEKPFPATGNRKPKKKKGAVQEYLTSQSNAFKELPTSQENKKGGGSLVLHIYSIIKLIVSSDNTRNKRNTEEEEEPGLFHTSISSNK
jgi:hypothetical protein